MKSKIPKFYGLRIYIITSLLYMLLVFPFVALVGMKNLPQLMEKQNQISNRTGFPGGSDMSMADTSQSRAGQNSQYSVTYNTKNDTTGYNFSYQEEGESTPAADFPVFLRSLLVSFALGLFFNYPFKRYFKLKRKRKAIPKKLFQFVKKWLLKVPLINALIFLSGLLFALGHSVYELNSNVFPDNISRNVFR